MKKLMTLILAAGIIFSLSVPAPAIDFKAKGNWTMSFDVGDHSTFAQKGRNGHQVYGYGNGGNNPNSDDNFSAAQRLRLQLDAVASEVLSGTVYFEIGTQVWGEDGSISSGRAGGALGTDGISVKVRRAYLDWIVPQTDLKVRMGLQGLALPSYAMGPGGSQILDDDVAGIVLNNKFTDNVSLTAFWARPYNDNYTGNSGKFRAGYMDNFDLFGLTLPLTFDGFKITPWAMLGAVGPNALRTGGDLDYAGSADYFDTINNINSTARRVIAGMTPAVMALKDWKSYKGKHYTMPFWLGLGGEMTAFEPFRLAWDVNYGDNNAEFKEMRRQGWFATLLAEYKLDWGTPGIYVWYASGDDNDVKNGSERMPVLSPNGTNDYSSYAGTGAPQIVRDSVLGYDFIGTWGVGVRLKDFTFLEGLKHTFRVNYFNGTNSPTMAKYILGASPTPGRSYSNLYTDFNSTIYGPASAMSDIYLTTEDHAVEFSLSNTYKIYDNLTLYAQASYVGLWLDNDRKIWGNNSSRSKNQLGLSSADAWDINVAFMYDF